VLPRMLFPAPRDNHDQRWQQNTVDPAPRVACALSSSPAGSGRALHCWQRCLHRLVAGYGKYWGCVPWRKPHIASLAYLHRSLPRLPLRPFPKARNPHLQRLRHPLCKKGEGSGCVRTGSIERGCRVEEHADLCFVLQLTALVLLDLYSFLESVSHRFVYRSAGR
jgi:hypothetical protein